MEHRWGERLPVSLTVKVSAHAFSAHEGRLIDVSVSGANLKTGFELRHLARVTITILLPHRAKHASRPICAYVARRSESGYGIEWCEFAPNGVCDVMRLAIQHPYAYIRHPIPLASVTRSRLSGPLLKHN